jgi:hypothetical protein
MTRGAVPIKYVGGPADGRRAKAQPKRLPRSTDVTEELDDGSQVAHRDNLKQTRTGVEFHYAGSA